MPNKITKRNSRAIVSVLLHLNIRFSPLENLLTKSAAIKPPTTDISSKIISNTKYMDYYWLGDHVKVGLDGGRAD